MNSIYRFCFLFNLNDLRLTIAKGFKYMHYCQYYQARVDRSSTWILTSTLKFLSHLAFDRTINKHEGIFEFFVPEGVEQEFLSVMKFFEDKGIVSDIKRLENRLKNPNESL